MKLKPGAKIGGAQPELLIGLMLIEPAIKRYLPELVITEITGGKHMEGSLHGKGLAADIRAYIRTAGDISLATLRRMRDECAAACGPDWDIILETDPLHLHIEYDPD